MSPRVGSGGWIVWGLVTALLAVAAGTMALWWY